MKLVERYPLGSGLRKMLRSCGGACCKRGPSHGPYWFARTPQVNGKHGQNRYVGSDEKKAWLELAWELVREELAQAEANAAAASEDVPAIRKLRELQAIAGVRKGRTDAGMVDVPILSMVAGETRPPK